MGSTVHSNYFVLPDDFKVLPPVQEEIAKTGNLSIRHSSKDFKQIFDQGLCLAWAHLKQETSYQNPIVHLFMLKIEERHNAPTPNQYLRFFQILKKKIHGDWNKHLFVIDPEVDIPTQGSFIGLLGIKYEKNNVPKKIKERALEIARLKKQIPGSHPIPSTYLDPETHQIMTLPLFNASHSALRQSLIEEPDPAVGFNAKSIHELCHTREKDPFYRSYLQVFSAVQCPVCQHTVDDEQMLIGSVLQEEILDFLRTAVEKETANKTNTGVSKTTVIFFRLIYNLQRTFPWS